MNARVVRIGLLLAAVGAALALAPAASAAIARGEGAERSSGADACAGPCPSVIVFKGPGSGRVLSEPASVDCLTPGPCAIYPDNESLGPRLDLIARPGAGYYLERWERCPSQEGGRCVLDLNIPGGMYTICVVFNRDGAPPVSDATCPPTSPPPPPPPPPPTGPPPLGSRCTIGGSARSDVISGSPGRDVICGRGGNDTINGRGGHDLLLGGAGTDRITGGGGRDSIYGGTGNDTLYARDGIRDTVNGGRGRDRARWDARDVRRSIERRL
jgi:hypothetical protein